MRLSKSSGLFFGIVVVASLLVAPLAEACQFWDAPCIAREAAARAREAAERAREAAQRVAAAAQEKARQAAAAAAEAKRQAEARARAAEQAAARAANQARLEAQRRANAAAAEARRRAAAAEAAAKRQAAELRAKAKRIRREAEQRAKEAAQQAAQRAELLRREAQKQREELQRHALVAAAAAERAAKHVVEMAPNILMFLDKQLRGEMCKEILTGLREGERGVTRIMRTMNQFIAPVQKPVEQALNRLTSTVKVPGALDKTLNSVAGKLRAHAGIANELKRLSIQLKREGHQLQSLLFDPRVVCGGNPHVLAERIAALGLRPNLGGRRSGLLDGLFVGTAHAAAGAPYVVIDQNFKFRPPNRGETMTVGIKFLTNFEQINVFYFYWGVGLGLGGSNYGVNTGIHLHLSPNLPRMALDWGMDVGTGELLTKLFEKAEKLPAKTAAALGNAIDGVDISFDERFKEVEAVGISHNWLAKPGGKHPGVAVTTGMSFRLD